MGKSYKNAKLNQDYFESIDTLDKAYFLGFIYADGNVRKDLKQLKFQQHISEIAILHRFCEVLSIDKNTLNINQKSVRLWISRKKLCTDLVKHGCIPAKSNIIRLPHLTTRELYLAFTLGYYDGDGKTQSTYITSGSFHFLEDIKKYFNIPFKIRKEERTTYHDNRSRTSYSISYELSLGAPLFNKMMDNYPDSLERKRKYYNLQNINSKYV